MQEWGRNRHCQEPLPTWQSGGGLGYCVVLTAHRRPLTRLPRPPAGGLEMTMHERDFRLPGFSRRGRKSANTGHLVGAYVCQDNRPPISETSLEQASTTSAAFRKCISAS